MLSIPDSDAKKKWDKVNTTVVTVKLNNNTDADIVHKLESVPNRQGYIKTVIRKDMADIKSK